MSALTDGDGRTLWLATWGTQSALTWARDAETAEQKVRRRALGRNVTWSHLASLPVRVSGPVSVRAASQDDLDRWDACEGPPVPGAS